MIPAGTTKIPLKVVKQTAVNGETCPDACGIIIFGASGDLAHRKLIPALYDLFQAKLFPAKFFIVGCAMTDWDHDAFRKVVLDALKEKKKTDPALQNEFAKHVYYQTASFSDPKAFQALAGLLKKLDKDYDGCENLMFHLAVPPDVYGEVIGQLDKAGLVHPAQGGCPWTRIIIEKPFGSDYASAVALNKQIHRHLDENQIYRIDHYLGKETVQNILMFRFANAIFDPLWDRRYIDHVQITAAETLGVEHRARYYEKAGVLRDMFQNHMLQLLATIAMEPPAQFTAEEYREEKVKVARAIRPIPPEKLNEFVVRGQYGAGEIDGEKVPEYRSEENVAKNSATETFAAMKLFVDNWRWQGVPFYLRSGKRLKRMATEIAIHFKTVPHSIFAGISADQISNNALVFRVQPDEGISLSFVAKQPGPKFSMATLDMDFSYKETFGSKSMGPYEHLLYDCMHGDQTLFVREDLVEVSWAFITSILDGWSKQPAPKFPNYASGSWGPAESDQLMKRDGRHWLIP